MASSSKNNGKSKYLRKRRVIHRLKESESREADIIVSVSPSKTTKDSKTQHEEGSTAVNSQFSQVTHKSKISHFHDTPTTSACSQIGKQGYRKARNSVRGKRGVVNELSMGNSFAFSNSNTDGSLKKENVPVAGISKDQKKWINQNGVKNGIFKDHLLSSGQQDSLLLPSQSAKNTNRSKINNEDTNMDCIILKNLTISINNQHPSLSSSRNRLVNNEFKTPICENGAEKLNNTGLLTTTQDAEEKDRRKFYIVQNGGSPAEMYCTDLVHKAKHGKSRLRNVDESRLMKCTDKWREEWNHGVQMPLSRNRPPYCYERISLFPDSEPMKFEQSKKYIAYNKTKYVKDYAANFEYRVRPSLFQYEIDNVDEEWLNSKEGSHITHFEFLKAINELEIDCYKNIHTTILEKLTFSRDNAKADDDADCDICCMPEWEPGDEIVFCDDCNMSVHQSCYGLNSLPTDDWMCATCVYRTNLVPKRENLPRCIFCPILGGSMKCTKNLDAWAHVVCALWIPEVRFGDVERRESITHISDVPADRWQAKCSICDTCNGACIRCTYSDCNVPFHVSCAQRSGLILQIEQNLESKNGVSMISLCSKHSNMSPSRNPLVGGRRSTGFTNFDRNLLSDMTQNFYKHVNVQHVTELCGIVQSKIESIFDYWRWKRKMHGCESLLNGPLDIKLLVQPKQIQVSQAVRQRNNIFNQMAHDQLWQGLEKVRTIRLNLEKARNLCYMISRREKLKRAHFETFEQSSLTMGSLLLDSVVPVSMRRADKLLETWNSTIKGMMTLNIKPANSSSSPKASLSPSHSPPNVIDLSFDNAQRELKALIKQNDLYGLQDLNPLKLNAEQFANGPADALRNSSSNASLNPLSQLPLNNLSFNIGCTGKNLKSTFDDKRRRENLYEFRSSTSPSNEHVKSETNNIQQNEIDFDGNVCDVLNFSEYSVAWSNTSESNGALFDFENGIMPVNLNGRKKKKYLNGKIKRTCLLNGNVKLKKSKFINGKKKLVWRNSSNSNGYVLHHPELALPPKRVSRSSVVRRI